MKAKDARSAAGDDGGGRGRGRGRGRAGRSTGRGRGGGRGGGRWVPTRALTPSHAGWGGLPGVRVPFKDCIVLWSSASVCVRAG